MENDMRKMINELLDAVTDPDLLDLVYKILLECMPSSPEDIIYNLP